MEHYGIWSVVPPLLAIVLAIWTRRVFVALFGGIWMSFLIIDRWHPLRAFYDAVMALVEVFRSPGNTKTIMFSALVGALILFVQKSGGVNGFVLRTEQFIQRSGGKNPRKRIQLAAWLTGVMIFVETSISSLTVGTVFRPLFDRLRISREKLAYIADSSSAPTSVMIPFNAWGAFIMGLLLTEGLDKPFGRMLAALPFNFYPMIALLLVLVVILLDWNIGPMKKAERRVRETGRVLNEGARPLVSDALTSVEAVTDKFRARNMLVPLAVMIGMMPVLLLATGWDAAARKHPESTGVQRILAALGEGSGSTAVLFAVITALAVAMLMYRAQGIARWGEMQDWLLKGISEMMPLALLMMMAFGIGAVTKQLGTGIYLAQIGKDVLGAAWLPLTVFILAAFIAFSTGTSWGTFAIMIPIAVPMALHMGVSLPLALAAVLSGGVFGDHASPVSDTTIISSMAAATDHIDHVKTQLPYALLSAGLAALLFVAVGFAAA